MKPYPKPLPSTVLTTTADSCQKVQNVQNIRLNAIAGCQPGPTRRAHDKFNDDEDGDDDDDE